MYSNLQIEQSDRYLGFRLYNPRMTEAPRGEQRLFVTSECVIVRSCVFICAWVCVCKVLKAVTAVGHIES